jgi:cellobiose phosphorylase
MMVWTASVLKDVEKVYGLGWFLYDAIKKFIPVMELKADSIRLQRYKEIAATLRDNLNEQAWMASGLEELILMMAPH